MVVVANAVAVLVDTVIPDLFCTRVDSGVFVVTVGAICINGVKAIAITIGIVVRIISVIVICIAIIIVVVIVRLFIYVRLAVVIGYFFILDFDDFVGITILTLCFRSR